jgi:hypothetical protein
LNWKAALKRFGTSRLQVREVKFTRIPVPGEIVGRLSGNEVTKLLAVWRKLWIRCVAFNGNLMLPFCVVHP